MNYKINIHLTIILSRQKENGGEGAGKENLPTLGLLIKQTWPNSQTLGL